MEDETFVNWNRDSFLKPWLKHKTQVKDTRRVATAQGKQGNLVLTFSRQGKHREFCFWHREKFTNTGKIFWLWLLTYEVCLFF